MNLIIQSLRPISPKSLDHLARLVRSRNQLPISTNAFRLSGCSYHAGIAPYCLENNIDYGFVAKGRSLKDFGLVVMDMDSTLITIECIDEIADMHGLKSKVSAITEAAMRGEIDFAESLRRRVALLEGINESALQQVYEDRLRLSPGADTLLEALKSYGIKTLLVSGGFEYFTQRLKAWLSIDYSRANTLEIIGGRLTGKVSGKILDAQGKADCLVETRVSLKLKPEQVIAIGDGANDLKMMGEAGTSIAYHAKPVVRSRATYAFNFVGLDGLLNLMAEEH